MGWINTLLRYIVPDIQGALSKISFYGYLFVRLGEQYDCDAGALSHDLDRGHAQADASINTSKVEIVSGGAVRVG